MRWPKFVPAGPALFVRSMVRLDREAAKRAFDGFLNGRVLTGNQIQFVNLVIDYLTQAGWIREEVAACMRHFEALSVLIFQ